MKITLYKINGLTVFGFEDVKPEYAQEMLKSFAEAENGGAKYAFIVGGSIEFHESYLKEQGK